MLHQTVEKLSEKTTTTTKQQQQQQQKILISLLSLLITIDPFLFLLIASFSIPSSHSSTSTLVAVPYLHTASDLPPFGFPPPSLVRTGEHLSSPAGFQIHEVRDVFFQSHRREGTRQLPLESSAAELARLTYRAI